MNEEKLNLFISKCHECPGHGYPHWRNVEHFGLMMAEGNPAIDIDVVRWFAYVHDSMRTNCFKDDDHGKRSAIYVDMIRDSYLSDLSDAQVSMLKKACELHNGTTRTGNPTIDLCFDADRIDLQRFRRPIVPALLATDVGRQFAKKDYNELSRLAKERSGDVLMFGSEYNVSSPFLGQLAVRCSVDKSNSPYIHGVKWDTSAKSVRITKQYNESGIYCVPLHSWRDSNSWFERFERMSDVKYSLLEYEMTDIKKHTIAPHDIVNGKLVTPMGMAEEEVALWKANIILTTSPKEFTDEAVAKAVKEFEAMKPTLYENQLRSRLEAWEKNRIYKP